ncbi:MAG: sensor histidine kinase, partial [Ktedonobacteraceae bacterium]|nr:sensor histidine kinase [Ktedonobacteraceae bacterium]
SVHNDGSSLSLEQQEHLFEPFYRGPNLWCSATLGWGLGLTISKHLVEQQGGRIWVESSEQQGTTFFVALPSHARA